MDLSVGLLLEAVTTNNSATQQLLAKLPKIQFENLRDNDPFWFENDKMFDSDTLARIRAVLISHIIANTTDLRAPVLFENMFKVTQSPCEMRVSIKPTTACSSRDEFVRYHNYSALEKKSRIL